MSRTVAHRPHRAWFDDPTNCLPRHDHSTGPCDLPPLAEWHDWVNHSGSEAPWRCAWELRLASLPRLCGCRLCTGHDWNRIDRRNDRHRSRTWLSTGRWVEDWDS